MAEIVNLKAVRKQADRTKKRAQADANAVKFGRTKAAKAKEAAEAAKAGSILDGHSIAKDGGE